MSDSILSQIEESFCQLSVSEQLRLIERLVHQVQQSALKRGDDLDGQLALMAADPQIQRELQRIEQDFAQTEADGLESA